MPVPHPTTCPSALSSPRTAHLFRGSCPHSLGVNPRHPPNLFSFAHGTSPAPEISFKVKRFRSPQLTWLILSNLTLAH